MAAPRLHLLGVPATLFIICFLGFSSQYLFPGIEPGGLTQVQSINFNILLGSLLLCYARCCAADPGYVRPAEPNQRDNENDKDKDKNASVAATPASAAPRWCRKCQAPKPPRAHHCKVCQRCILRMDHHCPWTWNCIGHRTLPHFVRFLFYSVVAMAYLAYFLATRFYALWKQRLLSSVGQQRSCDCDPISNFLYSLQYLGPSSWELGHLLTLCAVNLIAGFALSMILCMSLWCIGGNFTAIESFEIDRHDTLMKRSRRNGGFVHGPGGVRIKLVKHEYPYDIGIYRNIAAAMGSPFPWMWFWPLASTPSYESGTQFETNGFNDPSLTWPPPDPEKMRNDAAKGDKTNGFVYLDDKRRDEERIAAFNRRQREDLARRQGMQGTVRQRRPDNSAELRDENLNGLDGDDDDEDEFDDDEYGESESDYGDSDEDGEGWRNADGERLDDYGVDEEIDAGAEEDVRQGMR